MYSIPFWSDVDNPYVSEIIDRQLAFANNALQGMNSYVETMVSAATVDIDIPLPAAIGTALDFDFSMDVFNDLLARRPVAPVINHIDDIVLPPAPNIFIPDIDTALLSNFWNDILRKLHDDLANGGYGIETTDETGAYERAKERERLEYLSQVEAADEVMATSGFKIPTGALIKIRQKARDQYQGKLATINRDIMLKRVDLFVQCRQYAIEKGIMFGEFFINLAKVQVDLYESLVRGAIAVVEAKYKNEMLKLEAFKAEVDAYSAEIRAITALYEFAASMAEREIKMQLMILQANLELAKTRLQMAIEAAKLRLAGITASADVYKAICASAIGTIHASASLSSSFGVSYGYSKSEAQSYSESV